ncbi:MAG: cytochrome c [Bacteroidota bacterium]
MRLLYFLIILVLLTISTCFAFKGKNDLLEDNLPDIEIAKGTATSSSNNSTTFSAEALKGKVLFKNNCASCHNKNMRSNMTGPALGGVEERWAGREELLYSWIRNPGKVLSTGDDYIVELYNTWDKNLMPGFANFSDADIENILAYVSETYN